MKHLTDEEILDVATQHCEFTAEGTYHLRKFRGSAIVNVVRECFELAELCRQAEAATRGVVEAQAPSSDLVKVARDIATELEWGQPITPMSSLADRLSDALEAHDAGVAGTPAPRRFRHKKRGTTYELVAVAELQAGRSIEEGAELVIYRGSDGKTWAREEEEFFDGRFEEIAAGVDVPREGQQ